MPGVCRQYAANGTCTYGAKCKFQHVLAGEGPSGGGNQTQTKKKGKKRKGGAQSSPLEGRSSNSAIDDFFAEFPDYPYDDTQPIMDEFHAMCDHFGWWGKNAEKADARARLKDAMVIQFNAMFGIDPNDLDSWHQVCQIIDISPIPTTVAACRKVVRSTHINIVDLVEHERIGAEVVKFETVEALSDYSYRTSKFFPADSAYAGGFLRHLLRGLAEARRRTHGDWV